MKRNHGEAEAPALKGKKVSKGLKIGGLVLALPAASLAIAISATGKADGANARHGPRGEIGAKIEYCKNCHGSAGEGFQGFYVAPRIAGQPAAYLENQFKAILDGKRDNPPARMFMVHALQGLSPSALRALADYFSSLNPPPAGGAPRHLAAEGRKIYEEGVPDANVPACAACHGPDGKGQDANPRLAGQLYSYTVAQLSGWKKGLRAKDPARPGEANLMAQIAQNLSRHQSEAVAAYLSSLR
jgi:cytochrome c553